MSLISDEIKIATITGPPFAVIILNWGLFGVLSIQVYIYFQAFPNEKSWLKIFVGAVYLMETTQTFLLTNTAWKILVSGFGNIDVSDEVGTSWFSVCGIGGLVGFLVRSFYAYRIVVISQKWMVAGSIIFMSFVSFAGALATAIILKQAEKFSILLVNKKRTFILFGIWGGPGAACDVLIAVSMCYYLYKRISNPYGRFSQTDALVSKLTRLTIETGVLTATTSILTLVLYYPHAFQLLSYFEVPSSMDAKLYSTTMLAMLNSRIKLGIVSKSATWQDNELAMAPAQDVNRLELNILPTDGSARNTEVRVTKEEVRNGDDPKIHCLSAPVH